MKDISIATSVVLLSFLSDQIMFSEQEFPLKIMMLFGYVQKPSKTVYCLSNHFICTIPQWDCGFTQTLVQSF